MSVSKLEDLCITRYLLFLEDACSTYIHLKKQKSNNIFSKYLPRILPTLKEQLNSYMSGTCSSSIRQEMLRRIISGEFPTTNHKCSYIEQNPFEEHSQHFSEGHDRLREMREHGRKCCSPCCTGAFIVETMACVIINDELKEIKIDLDVLGNIIERSKPIRKYLHFDLPAILAHYEASIRNQKDRNPQLERFIIHNTGLRSREFAGMSDNPVKILSVYDETSFYLTYPMSLSGSADQNNAGTLPFSEDLFERILQIFSYKPIEYFDKLTEIVFGSELRNYDRDDEYLIIRLFEGIGRSCNNLRIFDISGALHIPSEAFVFLFLRHPTQSLHTYAFLPPYEFTDEDNFLEFKKNFSSSEVYRHSWTKYCPWCEDEWAVNGVRHGADVILKTYPVIEDELYDLILQKHPTEGPKYLAFVVKASDLWKSVFKQHRILHRPPGPDPFAPGFVPPDGVSPERDGNSLWYPVPDPNNVEYLEQDETPVLTDLCEKLQVLKTSQMGPRHEMLPFLIAALPNIKDLGDMDVMQGLKFMKENPSIDSDVTLELEEVSFDIVAKHMSYDRLTATQWAPGEIKKDIGDFYLQKKERNASLSDQRKRIKEDIQMLAEFCPHISRIRMFLCMEEMPDFLVSDDTELWEGLKHLHKLEDITVMCTDWENTSALFKVVGPIVKKLCVSVSKLRSVLHDEMSMEGPAVDKIFSVCTNLQSLKMDVSSAPLNLSETLSPQLDLSKLRKLTLGVYLTEKAFDWLWEKAVNLEEILVSNICKENVIRLFAPSSYQAYFSLEKVKRLFQCNRMKKMTRMKAFMCLKDIKAAEYLVKSLSENSQHLEEVGRLTIRVKLPEENYATQEELLNAMLVAAQEAEKFRQDCNRLNFKVLYSFEKKGVLQSIGNGNFFDNPIA